MARHRGSHARIDAHEQHAQAGADPVFQPQMAPALLRRSAPATRVCVLDLRHFPFQVLSFMFYVCLMSFWLFKEEPSHYSFDDLAREGSTTWSGVKNALAQKHLRGVRKADRIFYYHTGDEKAIVGIARATGDAYADPADKAGKMFVVDVAPVKKLPRPITLAKIKADTRFAQFPLVRISRLSVMPVSDD